MAFAGSVIDASDLVAESQLRNALRAFDRAAIFVVFRFSRLSVHTKEANPGMDRVTAKKKDTTCYGHVGALLAAVIALTALGPEPAKAAPGHGAEAAKSDASPKAHIPGLGDLMIGGVQPRHIKLWLAGKEKNWPLAAYELDELREALADVVRFQPHWNDLPIANLVKSTTNAAIQAVKDAIVAGDAARFTAAYGQLTDGCNSCHRSAGHGYLIIRVPRHSPFPDQDFRRVKD